MQTYDPDDYLRTWTEIAKDLPNLHEEARWRALSRLADAMASHSADEGYLRKMYDTVIESVLPNLRGSYLRRTFRLLCERAAHVDADLAFSLLSGLLSARLGQPMRWHTWRQLTGVIETLPPAHRQALLVALTRRIDGGAVRTDRVLAYDHILDQLEMLPVEAQRELTETLAEHLRIFDGDLGSRYKRLYNVVRTFAPGDQGPAIERLARALSASWATDSQQHIYKEREFSRLLALAAKIPQMDARASALSVFADMTDALPGQVRPVLREIKRLPKEIRHEPLVRLATHSWDQPEQEWKEVLQSAYDAIVRLPERDQREYAQSLTDAVIRAHEQTGHPLHLAVNAIARYPRAQRKVVARMLRREVRDAEGIGWLTRLSVMRL